MQYIIVTRYANSSDRVIVGVVTATERGGRVATEQEQKKIIQLMRDGGTVSLADALGDKTYFPPRVFDNRAAARKATAELNKAAGSDNTFSPFTFSVMAISATTPRNLRKIKGWEVYLNTSGEISSACEYTGEGASIMHNGYYLFATRSKARAAASGLPLVRKVRPVYKEAVSVYADE